MLNIHYGNRHESFAASLSTLLSQTPHDALRAEIVAVQHAAVARWLSFRLASQLGIVANINFCYPAQLVWSLFRDLLDDVPATNRFDAPILTYRLMKLFDRDRDAGYLGEARDYLADGDPLKQFQLATRLAQTFAQYLVYRPDWLERWAQGRTRHWQAMLWRKLLHDHEDETWLSLKRRFLDVLEADPAAASRLPERLILFGVHGLSPTYLAFLDAVAAYIDVHLFALCPQVRQPDHGLTAASHRDDLRSAPDVDGGENHEHPFVVTMGRSLEETLVQLAGLGGTRHHQFDAPPRSHLLGRIQREIFQPSRGAWPEERRKSVAAADRSIEVHVCHSALREVEVLHDQLLWQFESDPTLTTADVLVLTPDIETYATAIDAVFGAAPENRRIPYRIEDCSPLSQNPVAGVLFSLLDLADSRYDANSVLALLEVPCVGRRFGIAAGDQPLLRRWIHGTRIRWGLDAEQRRRLELPLGAANTWSFGVDRLLLGYALPPEADQLFGGVAPYSVDAASGEVVGRLRRFLTAVAECEASVTLDHTVSGWSALLTRLIDTFIQVDPGEEDHLAALRRAIGQFSQCAESGGYRGAIPLRVVRAALLGPAGRAATGDRSTGSVTFGALVPMRALPYRVICLIGMNDGAFPAASTQPGFDLMKGERRRGDRVARDEDRSVFLELLLSARDRFVLSYVGRNVRDDSVVPPSVLVAELLDHLGSAYCPEEAPHHPFSPVVSHSLQPFSERYFTQGTGLFSYAREFEPPPERPQAAGETGLFRTVVPEAEREWRTVDLEELDRFLRNPARFLIQRRLGIDLLPSATLFDTREPVGLDFRAAKEVRAVTLSTLLRSADLASGESYLSAIGLLPPGALGQTLMAKEADAVQPFAETIRPYLSSRDQRGAVDLSVHDFRLVGELKGLGTDGIFEFSVQDLSAFDVLSLWVNHLALNALVASGQVSAGVLPQSRLLAMDQGFVLNATEAWHDHLYDLLCLYWQGLHRPVKFFPRSAWAFMTAARSPRSAANRVWFPSQYGGGRGEWGDPYVASAFPDPDCLDEEFEEMSRRVYQPILNCVQEG